MKSVLHFVGRKPAPSLLPILRSQQQGEVLALLLGDPGLELSLTEIAAQTGVPHPSVYREVQRAEQAGLVTSRKVGNARLVRANTASPYYAGLADVLTRAFGVPAWRRLREQRLHTVDRGELSGDRIFNRHVRPLATRGAQALPRQERLCRHPVAVVGGDVGAVNVTASQGSCRSSINPPHRARDQRVGQDTEVPRLEALQAVLPDQVLDSLLARLQRAITRPAFRSRRGFPRISFRSTVHSPTPPSRAVRLPSRPVARAESGDLNLKALADDACGAWLTAGCGEGDYQINYLT